MKTLGMIMGLALPATALATSIPLEIKPGVITVQMEHFALDGCLVRQASSPLWELMGWWATNKLGAKVFAISDSAGFRLMSFETSYLEIYSGGRRAYTLEAWQEKATGRLRILAESNGRRESFGTAFPVTLPRVAWQTRRVKLGGGFDNRGNPIREVEVDLVERASIELDAGYVESVPLINRDTGAPVKAKLELRGFVECMRSSLEALKPAVSL